MKKVPAKELFLLVKEAVDNGQQSTFQVTGSSMLPFLGGYRDYVTVEKRDYTLLRKGDIILFYTKEGNYILHRIYRKDRDKCQTMGDGNDFWDTAIDPDQIIALVVSVKRKGRQIDCRSFSWRIFSWIWRKLWHIRGPLLRLMRKTAYIKSKRMK